MSLPQIQVKQYRIEAFTHDFMFSAIWEPLGNMMIFINSPDRRTILFKKVTVTPLDAASTINAYPVEELLIRQEELVMIRPLDELSQGTAPLLPVKEKLRIFIPRFVIQAQVSHGPDTKVADMFDTVGGNWISAADVHAHSVLPVKTPLFHKTPQLLLSRRHVRFYHTVNE